MKAQCLPSDRISFLPSDIITKNILCLMPIQDAVRTSVLSRIWRYRWLNIPKLVFDQRNLMSRAGCKRHKFFNVVYQVLLLHCGPMLELSLCVKHEDCFEIDPIIFYLSRRSKNLQSFTLNMKNTEGETLYKLPSSFFSLKQLTHLSLTNCAVQLPLTFEGFCMLTSLYMKSVNISIKSLIRLVSNCPFLKSLSLIKLWRYGYSSFMIEFLNCLSMLEHLCLSFDFEWTCSDEKLQTSLVRLKSFHLLNIMSEAQVDFLLLVTRSSPNLVKVKLEFNYLYWPYPEPPDHSVCFASLSELEINYVHEDRPLEFLEYMLVNSPVLKKVRVKLGYLKPGEELEALRSFLCLPRASLALKIIVDRPL